MIIIDQEEVIEVSSDLPCRIHRREKIEFIAFRERREVMRQHAGLDLVRHMKLIHGGLALTLLAVLLFDQSQSAGNHFLHKKHETDYSCQHHTDIERSRFEESPLLYDSSGQGLTLSAKRVFQFHDECVFAARKVCIIHRVKVASSDSHHFLVESL